MPIKEYHELSGRLSCADTLLSEGNAAAGTLAEAIIVTPKVGRNDPCCGSGKKFKQCCGRTTLH
jgi:SEC-C motif